MVHSVTLLLVLVILMPYAGLIPMPTIAAILFMVAYNMCQWRSFVRLVKTAPKSDIAVLVLTFILTVVFDLVVAIEIGMLLACLLFMKRMSDETSIKSWKYTTIHEEESDIEKQDKEEREQLMHISDSIRVYEMSGPLFFGAADRIGTIIVKDMTKYLILRMRSVPAMDITAMNAMDSLYEKCKADGIILILSHVNEQPMRVMQKSGFYEKIGSENFCRNIYAAIERAESLLKEAEG